MIYEYYDTHNVEKIPISTLWWYNINVMYSNWIVLAASHNFLIISLIKNNENKTKIVIIFYTF